MLRRNYNPIRYRAVKIAANTTKGALLAHMALFPQARRTVPQHDPARRGDLPDKRIPRIIWQTNYTDRVTLPLHANFRFNRFMAPEFEYRYCTDADQVAFIAEHFPQRYGEAFHRLQIGAAKADFWRVLVLLKHGGIYHDIDSNFSAPPEGVIAADDEALFIHMDNGEVTNYCMAAAPGHPVLQAIADRIVENIAAGTLQSVYDMTGPTVVDEVVKQFGLTTLNFRALCTQGQFTNKRAQYEGRKHRPWSEEQTTRSILKD